MATKKKSVFEVLNNINVNEHTEQKGKLTYLSWAWAWQTTKKHYPEAFYTIYENDLGMNYHHDSRTAWVKTGITIEGLEHIEYLPVLDFRNNSIPVDKLTSMAVNTSIQRSLTKAIARHGLGLYIYAGEDLPDVPVWEDPKEKEVVLAALQDAAVNQDDIGIAEIWREVLNDNENKSQASKQSQQLWAELRHTPDTRQFLKESLDAIPA